MPVSFVLPVLVAFGGDGWRHGGPGCCWESLLLVV
jgi:hypothetical protein